jgi:hypothetical protein
MTKVLTAKGELKETLATLAPPTLVLLDDLIVTGAPLASYDTLARLGGNIPATYKHLKLHAKVRGDTAPALFGVDLRLNGDVTPANYDMQVLYGSGAAATSQQTASALANIDNGTSPAAGSAAGAFASHELTIEDYLSTVSMKTVRNQSFSSALYVVMKGVTWKSLAALTRIQLIPNAGNFVIGSRFSLYGVN